jgi:cytochrome bd-type quinol oxidase subunit 1
MNYPVWQLGIPSGMLIAFVAVLHVFVSHFAVGGGAYLVLTERKAYRENDDALLAYVRDHSKFFALLTLVFGAVTGVGIWFTIGLASPEATSSLIHTFVWAWAIEWVFFFVEITAALIYAYNWDRLDRRTHLSVGWIYFVAAWMSLAVINGIITYMLTPGRWLQTHQFWDGFFNPTYLPSLVIRTVFAVALAGVFGLFTALDLHSPHRERALRWAGKWLLAGLVLTPLAGLWYYSKVPDFSRQYFGGFIPAAQHTFWLGIACTAIAILLTLVFTLFRPQWLRRPVMTLLLFACFGALASGEFMREFARKPYVINGYIYANDVRVSDIARFANSGGMVINAKWMTVPQRKAVAYGQQVFAMQCGSCHSLDGYRPIRPRVRGWDAEFATGIIPSLQLTRGTMPVFAGDKQDAAALGAYLATLAPMTINVTADNQLQAGREVFDVHCAMCHSVGGKFRPLAIAGADADAIEMMVKQLPDLDPHMPPFSGTDTERHALAIWLSSQK